MDISKLVQSLVLERIRFTQSRMERLHEPPQQFNLGVNITATDDTHIEANERALGVDFTLQLRLKATDSSSDGSDSKAIEFAEGEWKFHAWFRLQHPVDNLSDDTISDNTIAQHIIRNCCYQGIHHRIVNAMSDIGLDNIALPMTLPFSDGGENDD